MTKRIFIVCGTGIATSTVVASRVKDFLRDKNIDATVRQERVLGDLSSADVILATTTIASDPGVPVISALPLLTGIGKEAVFEELAKELGEV